MHKSDFKVDAEWNFFATSHGKSACDGIGGTVKRLASCESLRRPTEDQILTPEDLQAYNWSSRALKDITTLWLPSTGLNDVMALLENRFERAIPIPRMQEWHRFVPLDNQRIQVSTFSGCDHQEAFTTVKKTMATRLVALNE